MMIGIREPKRLRIERSDVTHQRRVSHEVIRSWTRDSKVGSQNLSAWAVAYHVKSEIWTQSVIALKITYFTYCSYRCDIFSCWTRNSNRIKAAEIKYVRMVKICSRRDRVRNVDMRSELGVFPSYGNVTEYRHKRKIYLQRIEQILTSLQAFTGW
jgi:hypothetical protein